jgi:hypothetical protein
MMSKQTSRSTNSSVAASTKARDDLDGTVINMELTLISIIQGVALYFLTDSTRVPLVAGNLAAIPYSIAGLLIILLFWSRSLIHTFTVIGWPLEFGHNFGYIACTLVEAIWFTQITNTRTWYLIGAVYAAMIWALFTFDLRMIWRRNRDNQGVAATSLFVKVEAKQLLHIRFGLPAIFAFYVIAAALSFSQEQWFIGQNGHVLFALAQLITAVSYLVYVLLFFRGLSPYILAYRQECGSNHSR